MVILFWKIRGFMHFRDNGSLFIGGVGANNDDIADARIANNATQLGLATKFEIITNQKIKCDMCGKEIYKYPCNLTKHNFCSRQCLADFSCKAKNPEHYSDLKDFTNVGKYLSEMNIELNKKRMTPETRAKIRKPIYEILSISMLQ